MGEEWLKCLNCGEVWDENYWAEGGCPVCGSGNCENAQKPQKEKE